MFVYNNNYKRELSQDDLARIARLKRAADSVYKYYDWLCANPLATVEGEQHAAQIDALRQDVKVALFFGDDQDPLVNYFIACVLYAIYNSHQEGAPQGTPCPVNHSKLTVMFDPTKVHELLEEADYTLVGYASGNFLLADNPPSEVSSMELSRAGELVMSDQELVDTLNLSQILIDAGQDDDDLTCSEAGETFVKELLNTDSLYTDAAI